jgi:hypothetical protein
VEGLFSTMGGFVETEWNGIEWQLQQQGDATRIKRASGVCIGRNDGSGVPLF